jgi:hypothetical protein
MGVTLIIAPTDGRRVLQVAKRGCPDGHDGSAWLIARLFRHPLGLGKASLMSWRPARLAHTRRPPSSTRPRDASSRGGAAAAAAAAALGWRTRGVLCAGCGPPARLRTPPGCQLQRRGSSSSGGGGSGSAERGKARRPWWLPLPGCAGRAAPGMWTAGRRTLPWLQPAACWLAHTPQSHRMAAQGRGAHLDSSAADWAMALALAREVSLP